MSSEAKQEWLEVWVVFSGHGHALGCYRSRTEAERHAKSFTRLKPLAEACTYCRYVPAVEQACAVPASGSLDDVFKYARFIPNMLIKAWDKGYSAGSADKARGAFGAERNPYLCLGKSKP